MHLPVLDPRLIIRLFCRRWLSNTGDIEFWGAGQIDSASIRVSFGPVGGSVSVVAEAGSVSAKVTAPASSSTPREK